MKTEIEIDDYLSEEDKTEIAKQSFKNMIEKNIIEKINKEKLGRKKMMSDYERIISNSVFYYLENEVDSITGKNTKALIKEGVLKTISKQDYNYTLFRKKSAWDSENSPAQQVVIDTIKECREEMKELIKSKFKENIENINVDDMQELINELISEVISDKLKS